MTLHTLSKAGVAGALAACTLGLAGTAWAHAHLKAASPAADATVSAVPSAVELAFTEPLEAAFSGIELSGPDGKPVATGKAGVAGADPARLVVPVSGALAPGRYQVKWHVLSKDGHRTNGSYGFTVK